MFRQRRLWPIIFGAALLCGCSLTSTAASDYITGYERSRVLHVIERQLELLEDLDKDTGSGGENQLPTALNLSRYHLEKIRSGRREITRTLSEIKGKPPAAVATIHRRTIRLLKDVKGQLRQAHIEEAFGERLIAIMVSAEIYQSGLDNEASARSLDDFLKAMAARAGAYEGFAARFRLLKPPAPGWNGVITASGEPFEKMAANLRELIPAITNGDQGRLTELNLRLRDYDAEMRLTDMAAREFIRAEKERHLSAVMKMRHRKNRIEESIVRLKVRLGVE